MNDTKFNELVGPNDGWDQSDTLIFVFYHCTKFGNRDINVDLDKGVLEVLNEEGTAVEEKYDISYTLTKL